ncbi:hypothetical protein ACWGNM_05900 [Streptomyces sp. NPDC055796]
MIETLAPGLGALADPTQRRLLCLPEAAPTSADELKVAHQQLADALSHSGRS